MFSLISRERGKEEGVVFLSEGIRNAPETFFPPSTKIMPEK